MIEFWDNFTTTTLAFITDNQTWWFLIFGAFVALFCIRGLILGLTYLKRLF